MIFNWPKLTLNLIEIAPKYSKTLPRLCSLLWLLNHSVSYLYLATVAVLFNLECIVALKLCGGFPWQVHGNFLAGSLAQHSAGTRGTALYQAWGLVLI